MRLRAKIAKQVDGVLVVGMHKADPVVLWRYDLKSNPGFGLSLTAHGNGWGISVIAANSAATQQEGPIAVFPKKEDAEEAFRAIQSCLMRGKPKLWGVVLIVLCLVVLAAGGYLGLTGRISQLFAIAQQLQQLPLASANPSLATMPGTGAALSPMPAFVPAVTQIDGEPQNADEVLRPPQ